jgi:hypothetical protein
MKTLTLTLVTLMASAGSALAASGSGATQIGIAGWIFLGFFGLIIATQFIPGLVLLASMLKGLFGKASEADARR